MKVLVTGGAGFIGSNFVEFLEFVEPTYKIVVVDKLTYAGNTSNLSGTTAKFIKGDISDYGFMNEVFNKHKFNFVINFAAETHVDKSIDMGYQTNFFNSNILGTYCLLKLSKEFGVERYIQISTDEVYGDLPRDSVEKFTEETPLNPHNPYSVTKASADMLCKSYHRTYELPVIITRCSNNYGEKQNKEKFIPNMVEHAKNNKPLPVYGDGENVRDWVHVVDHCRAIYSILEKGKVGEVYNIGGNTELKNIDVGKMILKILGKSTDKIKYVKDRLGHDFRYAMDITKIKKELGWSPTIDFEEGLEELIR
jgi:dTDP-glucose 4,6-dehydratase